MIVTDRDKEILRFIEEHKSITINQCAKIFFKGKKQAYYQARKRLAILFNNQYLKKFRHDYRSETIYFIEQPHLSYHDLKVFDIYAELISIGVNIKFFETKYKIPTPAAKTNYRESDALIEVEYKGYFYPILVEVDLHHFTTKEKLMDVYQSKHFQNRYGEDVFPTVLILRPYLPNTLMTSDLFDIYTQEFNSIDLSNIF